MPLNKFELNHKNLKSDKISMKPQLGMSLIEVLVVLAIGSVVLLGVLSIFQMSAKMNLQAVATTQALQTLRNLQSLIQDGPSWQKTISAPVNTGVAGSPKMDCLANSTPCTEDGTANGTPISGKQFAVFDRLGGAPFYDPTPPTNGFRLNGQSCNTFSASGNDSCPLRFDVQWKANCSPPTVSCTSPQVVVTIVPQYAPSSNAERIAFNPANYSGTIILSPSSTVGSSPSGLFDCTGSDQIYQVPPGCTTLHAKLWGAAGQSQSALGGAGGFTQGDVSITAGEILTVIVGCSTGFGGGGAGLNSGAMGGGRTAIRRGTTELMTAGGGGGGGGGSGGQRAGGAGGGANGQNAYSGGGTQTAGGAGADPSDNPGIAFKGGDGNCPASSAPCLHPSGGGGGGYFGGGGTHSGQIWGGGAGGGSGFTPPGGVTIAGNWANPPQTSDSDYKAGIADGNSGGNGYAVLRCD